MVLRFKNQDGDLPHQLARVKINSATENMSREDLITTFRELTGVSEKDVMEMANKEPSDDNLKLLLHTSILYANEVGEPQGQVLEERTQVSRIG